MAARRDAKAEKPTPYESNPERSPVLIVTGSSSGIGAATAILAARRGFAVCVNYLRAREKAADVVRAIQQEKGRALAVQADISSEPDVVRLFETVDRELGPISALVNNAATIDRQTRLDAMDAARIERIFATNVVGAFLCSREAVRRLSTRYGGKGGAIVNVSSGAARVGSPGEYIKEVAEEGIRVNAVRPGFIYTDLHTKAGDQNESSASRPPYPCSAAGNRKRWQRRFYGFCRTKRRT
jgi:NAD(P)-dependent dehydrogenase (short-subunit alcohol dehydrogenase family)